MNDPIIVTFTDLKKAFFRHIFALRVMAVVFFLGAFVFLLIKEPQFLAEVSVQRTAKITDYYVKLPKVYRAFLNYPIDTNAILKMDSNQVLKPVVEELGLQMVVKKSFWNRCLENAKENILTACGRYSNSSGNFSFSCINYESPEEMSIFLQITSANTYQIVSMEKKILAEGQIAQMISTPFFSMRVDQFPKQYKMNTPYYFILTPWGKVIEQIRSNLEIRPNKLENSHLKIYFSDHNETLSTKIIHHIIQSYEKFVSLEKDQLFNQSKKYLKKREEDLLKQLDTAFVDYASNFTTTSNLKWSQEQVMLVKKELGVRLLEQIASLIEEQKMGLHTYNTARLQQSAASLHPPTHNLIAYSLLSSFMGLLIGYGYFVSRMIIRGIPVSYEGLMAANIHSCGVLSSCCGFPLPQLFPSDLKTLRQICTFIESHKIPDRSLIVSLITEQHPDYTPSLASLLALRGFKVLMIDCSFDQTMLDHELTLIQYLEGSVAQIPICHLKEYDKASMGQTEYGFEWLVHPKFSSALLECKQYDLILLTTTIAAKEVEGHFFCKIADCVVVTTQTDSKQDLLPYTTLPKKQNNSLATFVIIEENS